VCRTGEPRGGGIRLDLAEVDGEDTATGPLDTFEDLALPAEASYQSVEVGNDEDVDVALLDHLQRLFKSRTFLDRGATGDVRLLERVDQLQVAAVTLEADTLSLLGRTDEALSLPAADMTDPDNANGTT
jgi:hypothetical protein